MTDAPLFDLLRGAARAHPGRLALRGEGLSLTYAQLLERIGRLASQLRTAGAGQDEPVLVKVSNHPLDFVAFGAAWAAGAVVVPVHRGSVEASVRAIQQRARCRWVVDATAGRPLAPAPDDAPGDAPGDAPRGAPGEAARHTGGHTSRDTTVDTTSDAAPHRSRDARAAAAASPVTAGRDILRGAALVIFTSGSTGLPKGVVLSHEAFAGKLLENQRLLQLEPDDVSLLVLNDTFSFGIWFALVTLARGATLVTHSRFAPASFLEALVTQRVTRVGVVPTMIRATFASQDAAVLAAAEANLRAARALRDVVIGGEPLGAELSARLRGFVAPARLWDVYGLTETSTSDFVLHPDDYPAHPGSIGRPAARVRHRIVDEAGAPCPPGVPGELQLATPFIMNGYLDDPQTTRAAFAGEWFRTGDLAVGDASGFVSIVGRLKDVIVRGGNKVTPPEIERALCACPGVAAALVTGVDDPLMGQRIHALLVPGQGCTLDAAAIRAALSDRLERFKQPDACYVAAELPTGRTGKIDRGQLRAMIATEALQPLASWTT